jgi:serine/threonine protein kinase
MPIAPGTRLGPYEIVSALGAGGMGEVYRARDRRLARDVAIKFLPASFIADSDRLARFAREAHLLASLNHANIAHVYGLEDVEPGVGARALVMELVEGPTLAERITAGAIPVDEALPIAHQIAEALEYAHDAGIVHRDLKPANIKLRPDGTVKVLDFGLAKAFDPARSRDSSDPANTPTITAGDTEPGVVLGTAAYMAPEQVRGRAIDKRIDIWAFGVVLFEMLGGRQAFTGNSPSDVMAAVIRDEPPWDALPESTPTHIRAVLRRCLERDPRQRLRDIGDARLLLEASREDAAVLAAPALSRRSIVWPVIAALGSAFAIAALASRLSRSDEVPALPIRFTVPQPAAVALNSQFLMPTVAMSPDGQRIVSVTPDGLLLWSASTATASMLDDTGGAVAPFFSPDGRHVAFFAQDQLRRVPIAGGPVDVITSAPNGSAGTWGRDDTILFTRWMRAEIGLWLVPAAGGAPRLIAAAATLLDLRAFPSFLPDARHYLFLKGGYGSPVGRREICVAAVAGGEPECVAQGDSNVFYAATGHLVFVRGGLLVALPFDADRRQATGAAMTLARAVRWFGPAGIAVFAVSADGRVLAHSPPVRPRRLLWVDRTGARAGEVGEPRLYNLVQLSPDGRRAAVDMWSDETGGRDLWVIDLATNDLTRVTTDPIDVYLGAWSDDSRSLLFSRPASGPPDIFEISADGGAPRPILALPGVQLAQHRSRSGWLAYLEAFGDKNLRHLWLRPPGGEPRRLRDTPASTWDARFSPDGRLLAYVSEESGTPEVYVTVFQENGPPRRMSRGGGFLPRWRGDARELFYLRTDGTMMTVNPSAESPDPRPLFKIDGVTPGDAPSPPRERYAIYDVTRDGQRFLLRIAEGAGDRADDLRVWVNWAATLR